MEVAGDRVALRGRNPEVGAAGVEDNLEGLGRSAEGDLGEVWNELVVVMYCCGHGGVARRTLGIQEVADGYRVRSVGDVGSLEHLLHVGLRLDAHVLLSKLETSENASNMRAGERHLPPSLALGC